MYYFGCFRVDGDAPITETTMAAVLQCQPVLNHDNLYYTFTRLIGQIRASRPCFGPESNWQQVARYCDGGHVRPGLAAQLQVVAAFRVTLCCINGNSNQLQYSKGFRGLSRSDALCHWSCSCGIHCDRGSLSGVQDDERIIVCSMGCVYFRLKQGWRLVL
jgi:hypothetical protein